MWVTILVVVGSVLLVVSGFAWAARRETLEQARAIAALDVSSIAALRPDRLQAVRGQVRPVTPVDDPVVGTPVAFFEARVFRTDGSGETLAQVRRGDTVRVTDAAGAVEVDLDGAELTLEMRELDHADREPSEKMRALLDEAPEPHSRARYALSHRALEAGAEVTVIGVPRPSGDGMRFSPANGPLWVTTGGLEALQRRELGDVRAMNRMLAVGAGVGVALLAVGGALMFTQA